MGTLQQVRMEQGDQLAFAALQVKERQVSRRKRRRMERGRGGGGGGGGVREEEGGFPHERPAAFFSV